MSDNQCERQWTRGSYTRLTTIHVSIPLPYALESSMPVIMASSGCRLSGKPSVQGALGRVTA